MSTINDWTYLKLNTLKNEPLPRSLPSTWAGAKMAFKGLLGFIRDLIKPKPNPLFQKTPKSPYDHIHVRGLV